MNTLPIHANQKTFPPRRAIQSSTTACRRARVRGRKIQALEKWDTTLEVEKWHKTCLSKVWEISSPCEQKPPATGSNPEGKQRSTPPPETIQGREGGITKFAHACEVCHVQT